MAKQFMQASNKFYLNKTGKFNEPTHFYEHIFVIYFFLFKWHKRFGYYIGLVVKKYYKRGVLIRSKRHNVCAHILQTQTLNNIIANSSILFKLNMYRMLRPILQISQLCFVD